MSCGIMSYFTLVGILSIKVNISSVWWACHAIGFFLLANDVYSSFMDKGIDGIFLFSIIFPFNLYLIFSLFYFSF
ncbi:unnamed protein product [Meloidogyne enterolobii]|uniref:Uncharacterized protein n=1 Tax=Meloidogyne enterolobii TaxID=390850 RepID=A0ACB0XXE0_MELEN